MNIILPRLLLVLGFAWLGNGCVHAQNDSAVTPKPARMAWSFNATVGAYYPLGSFRTLSTSGQVYGFQFQGNYLRNLMVRLSVDQIVVPFQDNALIEGINFSIQSKLLTSFIGLDVGYYGNVTKRFAAFIYSGSGFALMDVPLQSYDRQANVVTQNLSSRMFVSWRGGLGAEFAFSRFFILSLEAQVMAIPFRTDLENKQLTGTSILLGFRTPL
jgi:hypothetical protein